MTRPSQGPGDALESHPRTRSPLWSPEPQRYYILTPWVMEPVGSMPHSQGLSNNSYQKYVKHVLFLQDIVMLSHDTFIPIKHMPYDDLRKETTVYCQ